MPSAATVIMLTYSAIWRSAKRIDEYSVWKPATSSVSRLGQVERRAVHLGGGRHQVDEEGRELREAVPVPEARRACAATMSLRCGTSPPA